MRINYKIEYNSTNSYFKDIINGLISEFGITGSCEQYNGFVVITVDDEEDKIQEFFKFLETSLPLSIFIGEASVVDFIDSSLEPLQSNESSQNIALSAKEIIEIYNTSTELENEANALKNGEIIELETANGIKKIALPTIENKQALGNDAKLMIINLNSIGDLLMVNPKDVQLLSSIERPLVKLKFNILRNRDKEYSSTNFVYTKLPDDAATYKLATALRKENVDYVIYSEDAKQEDIVTTYTDEQTVIVRGDKTIFPRYDYTLNETFENSQEYFEKNGGIFKATLSQFNKRINPSIGVYMSMQSDESSIAVNVPTKGVKVIIQVPNVMTDFDTCIEDIEGIDENTPRLIKNYKDKFPEVFNTQPKLKDTHGFETILSLTAHMIGLEDAKALEDCALEYNAKSGIDIDYKVVKIDDVNYLDYRRIVQSIMSYKMAGVENPMLAFSVYESLSEFIVDNVTKINAELNTTDLVLCGDMFSNSVLLSKTKKDLPTFNVLLPKEYPLDI